MTVSVERLDAPTVRREAGDGYAPLLRCDDCGGEISKPANGRVAWRAEEVELSAFLAALIHNLEVAG